MSFNLMVGHKNEAGYILKYEDLHIIKVLD